MNEPSKNELAVPTRRQALRVSRMIGCEGAHQDADGNWMPCSSHGKLSSIIGSSKSDEAIEEKSRVKARSDRLAATPALPSERISGSERNETGSAASASAANEIDINAATVTSLTQKVKDHNEKVAAKEPWRKASLSQLKAVYRRGAGAFSVSHRPGMTRGQWAMGRVNAFLKILESGKPANPRYVGDNDLLPRNHPWKSRMEQKGVRRKRKRVGTKPRDFQRLTERGVLGIQTLAGGGLVSSPVSVKTDYVRSRVGSFSLLQK